MSTDQVTTPEIGGILSREQLLEAIDCEIEAVASERTATGWTYWAIFGALAALLWVAIDCWERGFFLPNNVLLLAVALSVTVDSLGSTIASLDTSLVSIPTAKGRFHPVARLLASARSGILFHLCRHAVTMAVLTLLEARLLWPTQAYVVLIANSGLLAFAHLLCLVPPPGNLPGAPLSPPRHLRWVGSAIAVLFAALSYAAPPAAWGVVWLNSGHLSPQDLRLALLCTAVLFLVSLAVESRVSTTRLNGLRTIRQNLAFARSSLSEAQTQADLLLIGGSIGQLLQPEFQELVTAFERLDSSLARTRDATRSELALAEQLAALSPQDVTFRSKCAEMITTAETTGQRLDEVEPLVDAVQGKVRGFVLRCRLMASLADGDTSDLDPYSLQLQAISARLSAQFKGLRADKAKARLLVRHCGETPASTSATATPSAVAAPPPTPKPG